MPPLFSCSFKGSAITVKALEPIPQGEQIFNCYGVYELQCVRRWYVCGTASIGVWSADGFQNPSLIFILGKFESSFCCISPHLNFLIQVNYTAHILLQEMPITICDFLIVVKFIHKLYKCMQKGVYKTSAEVSCSFKCFKYNISNRTN